MFCFLSLFAINNKHIIPASEIQSSTSISLTLCDLISLQIVLSGKLHGFGTQVTFQIPNPYMMYTTAQWTMEKHVCYGLQFTEKIAPKVYHQYAGDIISIIISLDIFRPALL